MHVAHNTAHIVCVRYIILYLVVYSIDESETGQEATCPLRKSLFIN